jgi:hypothetical protein
LPHHGGNRRGYFPDYAKSRHTSVAILRTEDFRTR